MQEGDSVTGPACECRTAQRVESFAVAAPARRAFGRILLAAAAIGVALAVCETVVRVWRPVLPYSAVLPLVPNTRIVISTHVRGVAPRSVVTTNSWGLRGDDPPPPNWQGARILAVGGSTTHCFWLDDRKTWPALLQQRLNAGGHRAWVANAGMDGHSTRGHLVVMRELASKLRPDWVLFLVGANDLGLSLDDAARQRGNPFEVTRHPTDLAHRLIDASALAQLAWSARHRIVLRREVVMPSEVSPARSLAGPEPPPPPLLSLEEYRSNLRALVRLTRTLGAEPVCMTQPMLYDDEPRWRRTQASFFGVGKSGRVISASTTWKLLEVFNQVTRQVCREERVGRVDLAATMPHSDTLFYDTVHFTESGAQAVADRIGSYLTPRLR